MDYITLGDRFLEGACTEKYNQIFYYRKTLSIDEGATANLYETGLLDDDDLKIIEFVYKTVISNERQILDFCEIKRIENGEKRVEKLFVNVVINRFALCSKESSYTKTRQIPRSQDVQYFYCLTAAGKILLEKYLYSPETIVRWNTGTPCMSSINVRRMLVSTEHYLNVCRFDNMQSYKSLVTLVANDRLIKVNSVFKLGDLTPDGNFEFTTYLTEAVLYGTEEAEVLDRLSIYRSFLVTKSWEKYFHNKNKVKPILLFITEDDESAGDIASMVLEEIPQDVIFYITTIERMKLGYERTGGLLSYDSVTNMLIETQI